MIDRQFGERRAVTSKQLLGRGRPAACDGDRQLGGRGNSTLAKAFATAYATDAGNVRCRKRRNAYAVGKGVSAAQRQQAV